MCRGIGQWIDNLQLLDDRAGPAVRDDERQRMFMFRPNVNEMNVEPIDLGHELREGIQPRLEPPEVIVGAPVAHEFLHRRQLHALRSICDGLLVGPASGQHTSAQLDEVFFRNIDAERVDCCRCGFVGLHNKSPLCWYMTDVSCDGTCSLNRREMWSSKSRPRP